MMSADASGRRKLLAQAESSAAEAALMGMMGVSPEALSQAAIAAENLNRLVDASSTTSQIQTVSYLAQAQVRQSEVSDSN